MSGVTVNWQEVLKKKEGIVGGLTKGIDGLFAKYKVDYLKGHGKITGPNSLDVLLNDGTTKKVEAKNILIATGSEATPFPGLPFDEKVIISSTGALSLPAIPKKLIVIGGGVIGVEMASVYARLGTDVTVIEFMDKLCPFLDDDISKAFLKSLKS